MADLKILVAGDIEGRFSTLFTRVSEIQRKTGSSFEYLFCVGSFFGSENKEWEDVVTGKIKVPITTYILGPVREDHLKYFPGNSEELVSNVIYLGKKGVLTGSSGLKIAYLSGTEKNDSTGTSFSKKDISELITSTSDIAIDILLTCQWPQGVTKYTKGPENLSAPDCGSNSIAYLAKQLKPRYHFSALWNVYYERVPYRNYQVLQEMPTHSTRFISLAAVGNNKKLKWIYAFKITPVSLLESKELLDPSIIVTECPYNLEDSQDQFFFDMDSKNKNNKCSNNMNDGDLPKKKQKFEVSREKCWFCLSNPDVEQQLIISIGSYSYLTIAKGGLVQDHLLIMPIKHIPSWIDLPESVEKEISRYKQALINYYNEQKKDVVFFERNLASPHLQIQVIPIPKSKTQNVKDTIFEIAENHGLEFTELSEFTLLKQIVKEKKSYFYIEIEMDKQSAGKIIHIINKKFPLQFGRLVLASKAVLDCSERIDWKSCKLSSEEELNVVESFRRSFKRYDFTA